MRAGVGASMSSIHNFTPMPACLVPESEFDAIPKTELVIDDAKIVLHDVVCRADNLRNFTILESFGDQFDYLPFVLAEGAVSEAFSP
jgi:hypothetical protein